MMCGVGEKQLPVSKLQTLTFGNRTKREELQLFGRLVVGGSERDIARVAIERGNIMTKPMQEAQLVPDCVILATGSARNLIGKRRRRRR